MTPGRILVAGESLVDIVAAPDGTVTEHVGGSPANVALALARLGRDVTLLTSTGDDERGRRIRGHLTGNEVHLLPDGPAIERTSTAVATLGEDGQATYQFDLINDYPDVAAGTLSLTGYDCLHTGSIAATLTPGGDQIRRIVADAHPSLTVSYDPNARPAIMGHPDNALATMERFVELSDIVKLSDEDAAWLAGDLTPEELAQAWLERGPAFVVVTRGPDGAYGVCRAGSVEVPGVTIAVADTVGAGDSFSGAIIDALARKGMLGAGERDTLRDLSVDDLADVMAFAMAVAGVTVSRPGADPPRPEEIYA